MTKKWLNWGGKAGLKFTFATKFEDNMTFQQNMDNGSGRNCEERGTKPPSLGGKNPLQFGNLLKIQLSLA